MAWTEDLTVFLDLDEFGITATIGGSPVTGIFDNETVIIDGFNGAVESTRPVFLCREVDVTTVVHGTAVVINAVNYKVRGIRPDGTGFVLLILELQ